MRRLPTSLSHAAVAAVLATALPGNAEAASVAGGADGIAGASDSAASAASDEQQSTVPGDEQGNDQGQAEPDPPQMGEIIVTANRREENLNKVGVTVAAITGDTLRELGVTSTDDLAKLVPGLQAYQSGIGGAPIYTLRGIGFNAASPGQSSPVGIYLDEVAIPYPYEALGLVFDLDRVEVLKGPQGTLFGRNTTGGLIGYVSAKPSDTPGGRFGISAANYGTYVVDGFVTGPITDTLKARFAWNVDQRTRGWQRSVSRPNETKGERSQLAIRASATWEPVDAFTLEASLNYWERDSDVQHPVAISFNKTALPADAFASLVPNPTNNSQADWVPISRQPTRFTTGVIRPDFGSKADFILGTVRATLDLSSALSIVSLSSLDKLNYNDVRDFGGTQTEGAVQHGVGEVRDFSQEVRLVADYGTITGSVGAYYAKSKSSTNQLGYVEENGVIGGLRRTTLLFINAIPGRVYTPTQIAQAYRHYNDTYKIRENVKAVFGNAEFALSDQIKLRAGARYTEDKTEFEGCSRDVNGNNLPVVDLVFPTLSKNPNLPRGTANGCITLNRTLTNFIYSERAQKQSNVSFRIGADWTPLPTVLVYGNVSRGYKAGSFPIISGNTETQYDPVRQERVMAYELGAKLGLLNRAVQINPSVYYYDYKDKQLTGRVLDLIYGTLGRIVNVPKSRVWGVEVDTLIRLSPAFTINASGSYLDTKVLDFDNFNEFNQPVNLRGRRFANSPKWQFAGTATYDAPITNDLGLATRVTVTNQSSQEASIAAGTAGVIDGYTLVDGSIGLHDTDRTWSADVFVTNAFDKYYWTTAGAGLDGVTRFSGMPRTYGVRFSQSF